MKSTKSPLCPTMPVLEHLHSELGGLHESVGALFGLQHLLGSTAALIRRIANGAIEPDNVFLLGKPYSANHRVVEFLRADLGFWVHPESCEQGVSEDNDSEIDRRVETTLDLVRHRLTNYPGSEARVVLIDDGGRAIRMLHADRYADIRGRFTCVEQTRCGIRTLEGSSLEVPVVNVAESWVKLEYESPMIADSVLRELLSQLGFMESAGIPTGSRSLVIGYGAIGSAVAAELRNRGRDVSVFDTQRARLALARNDGHTAFDCLHAALRRGGLIVGCTGKPILDQPDYQSIPDGSILVSASSADVEFRAWQLRPGAQCLGRPESWPAGGETGRHGRESTNDDHPCFSLYRVRNGRGRFYLVNGGFPVNFDGSIDPISPRQIQLTRSLLYLGAFQASHANEPGLHDLDDRLQRMLMAAYAVESGLRAA